jgi:hypothetical protein
MIVGLPPERISGLPHPVGDNLCLKLPGIYSNPLSVTKCRLDQNQFSIPEDRHRAFFQNNGIPNQYTVHNTYRRPSFE